MKVPSGEKGITPVVASIVLCGVVLIIGVGVWSLTYAISNGLSESYYEGIIEQIDTISERFTVEHIAYNNDSKALQVWVYNYGNVSVNVDIYVFRDGVVIGNNTDSALVSSGNFLKMTINFQDFLSPGIELLVQVISRRQNFVYQPFVVPSTQS